MRMSFSCVHLGSSQKSRVASRSARSAIWSSTAVRSNSLHRWAAWLPNAQVMQIEESLHAAAVEPRPRILAAREKDALPLIAPRDAEMNAVDDARIARN